MRIFAMRPGAPAFAVLLLLAAGQIIPAGAQAPTATVDAKWVETRHVVAPIVPVNLLLAGTGSELDARVRVGPDGRLIEVLALTSSPSSPELEAAFRSALGRWKFRIDTNRACEPVAYEGRVQAAVEISTGKARTRVLQPPRLQVRERVPGASAWPDNLRESLQKSFPIAARRAGVEADVVASIDIATDTGVAIQVTPVIVELLGGVESPELVEQFKAAAVEALASVRYSEGPLAKNALPRRCISIDYRLPR
ncbi:MAG: hypothetical protein SF172_16065 [Burkholderiales bacterium]|nr:hypothetical protein [Burkholderiales bacterium]